MIMFTKTHDEIVNKLKKENELLEDKKDLAESQRDREYEENRILKVNLEVVNGINMKLRSKSKKNQENYFKTNAELLNKLDLANKKINELENKYKKLEKRKNAFETLYKKYKNTCLDINRVNVSVVRKLWCTGEAKRQLRRLADNEEITNINKLRKKINELTNLIGL